MSNRTTLEQGRAAFAYQSAKEGAQLTKNKEYKSYVKKLPMYIKTNGLGAAIAFVFSKGAQNGTISRKTPWGLLYGQIEDWLLKDPKQLITFESNNLTEKITKIDSSTYRAVTVEVLALLNWLKRFSDALIEGESQNTNE